MGEIRDDNLSVESEEYAVITQDKENTNDEENSTVRKGAKYTHWDAGCCKCIAHLAKEEQRRTA